MTAIDTADGIEKGLALGEKMSHDNRDIIPLLGFKEYWYPALPVQMVRKKPLVWKMLGKNIVLFRGKEKDTVAAIDPMCIHRNASLTEGECHWRGTITCPYHGWTYNEEGVVVACLNEGPNSTIPETKPKTRMYPTQVLRGMIFVWMGEGEPAPIEEDVPPEFFMPDSQIKFHIDYWRGNWRASAENGNDGHASYLHRNGFRMGTLPHYFVGPIGERYKIVNKRYIKQVPPRDRKMMTGKVKQEFPHLGHAWPKSQWRKLWTWMFEWAFKRNMNKPPLPEGVSLPEEWDGVGQHMPGMVRRVDQSFVYSRAVVPVTETLCRQVYYHWSPRATGWLSRLYETVHFTLYGAWNFNINFSQQDQRANAYLVYGLPEYLAPNDACIVAWRKLCTMARDLQPAAKNIVPADTEAPIAESVVGG